MNNTAPNKSQLHPNSQSLELTEPVENAMNKISQRQDRKPISGFNNLRNHQLLFFASLLFISYSEAFAATTNSYIHKIQRGGSLSASTEIEGELSDNGESYKANISMANGIGTEFLNGSNGFASDEVYAGPRKEKPLPCQYVAETNLPTDVGEFRLRAYRVNELDHDTFVKNKYVGSEPCVIYSKDKPPFCNTNGDATAFGLKKDVPVRIHDQCFTSEVFRSQRCDCKQQLKMALEYLNEHGGAIIYLQQEGRGIGIANKVAAYALQDNGMDTVDANTHLGFPEDARQYGVVPSILSNMGIESIRLMTNNPRKIDRLTSLGVNVVDTIPMVVERPGKYNRKYLQTKQDRMNHRNFGQMLSLDTQKPEIELDELVEKTMSNLRNENDSSIAEEYVDDDEEMAAAAIDIALLKDETSEVESYDSQDGVTAADDGYCFGRKSVEDAIAAVARGEIVVVVDDMDRENEGDFIMSADLATPEAIAIIVRYSSGVICIGMEGDRMDELKLPAMLKTNEDPKGTAFSVTVDATEEHGITTGISAMDRARTLQLLAKTSTSASDFARPGHIFPLRAQEGGVLTRDGHTEAAVDLSRLAGRHPSGVLCEIVSEENPVEMARLPELKRFCKKHGFVLTSIVDIAQYRRDTEDLNQ